MCVCMCVCVCVWIMTTINTLIPIFLKKINFFCDKDTQIL